MAQPVQALDPYRSKVRSRPSLGGRRGLLRLRYEVCGLGDIVPLFELPLAIFNAVFEVKRLIHEAKN